MKYDFGYLSVCCVAVHQPWLFEVQNFDTKQSISCLIHNKGFYATGELYNTVFIRDIQSIVFVLYPLLISHKVGRAQALSPACKIDQADLTVSMSFLPSNLMEVTSANTETLSANT